MDRDRMYCHDFMVQSDHGDESSLVKDLYAVLTSALTTLTGVIIRVNPLWTLIRIPIKTVEHFCSVCSSRYKCVAYNVKKENFTKSFLLDVDDDFQFRLTKCESLTTTLLRITLTCMITQ